MTNFLTDFRGGIVSHSPHHAAQLCTGMVQWLSFEKLLMLSHVNQYDVGSIPLEVSYFWLHLGQFSFIFLYIRLGC